MKNASPADQSLLPVGRLASPSLQLLAAGALVIAVLLRIKAADGRPLWLDETFTGAIAAEPTIGGVLRQTLLDINAPGFYLLAHAWTSFFSLSNESLRMPSFIVGLLAPLLCLIPTPGLGWRARLLWFASVALWHQAATYSYEARCYSVLYFCVIANTLAFMRLVADIRPATAFLWGLTSAVTVFFHYVPIALIGAQFLILLWILRERIFRLWPAAIPLTPAAIWFFVHLSRIREFTQKDVAWYHYLTIGDIPALFATAFGFLPFVAIMFLAAVLFFEWRNGSSKGDHHAIATEPVSGAGPWLAAAAGVGAALLFVAIGFFRPSFTPRYLFAFAPAFLLLLPLMCERVTDQFRLMPAICLGVLIANGALAPWFHRKIAFEYETGSEFLMKAGVRNVAFLWDNPNNQAEAPEQMRKVGGFFFDRKNANVVTTPLRLPLGADPNVELQRFAATPKSGFIWLYDVTVRHTAAKEHMPRMAELSRNFDCRRTGLAVDDELMIGALSCIRKDPT